MTHLQTSLSSQTLTESFRVSGVDTPGGEGCTRQGSCLVVFWDFLCTFTSYCFTYEGYIILMSWYGTNPNPSALILIPSSIIDMKHRSSWEKWTTSKILSSPSSHVVEWLIPWLVFGIHIDFHLLGQQVSEDEVSLISQQSCWDP